MADTDLRPQPPERRCTVILLDLGVPCEKPSETELVMGCIHEHMETDAFCGRHKYLALDGELVCTVCAPMGVRVISHVLSAQGRRCL